MKNNQYIMFAVAGLMVLAISCKRSLETVPVEQLTKDYIFNPADSGGANASLFLSTAYTYLPNGFARVGAPDETSGDFLDCADDDGISSAITLTPIDYMETGGLTPYYNPDDGFVNGSNPQRDFYTGIRLATEFIDNIDIVPVKGVLSDGTHRSLKAEWKAEARFIRAYCYFELLKRYGGVPLMGDVVRKLGDNVQIPRSSFADCVQYISTELDSAKAHLRLDPIEDIDFGRATEGAAMALKSRLLLYAASPLYNGGNVAPGNNLTGYTDYDVNRWKLAADAANAVITYGRFSLDNNTANPFNDLFTTDRNSEIILAIGVKGITNYNVSSVGTIEQTNGPVGFNSAAPPGHGRTGPTEELVEAFGTINGKPITQDIKSPTNPKGFNIDSPFINRDPRFNQTILYNGATWLGATLQTYDGGVNKPGGNLQQTKTGYYLRKFLGDNTKGPNYIPVFNNFIAFRYGEILLNYAEAENEFSGPTSDVVNYIDSLRKRGGVLPGSDSRYGIPMAVTKDNMRQIIQNERRVEMAFEEQRFWDIRRWKIAAQVYSGPFHGYQIIRNTLTGALTASVQPVLTPVWNDKMYLYPIPYNEVVSNNKMKQNPGW